MNKKELTNLYHEQFNRIKQLEKMIETLIGNIDTLFDAYPEKMPLEDAMRHWQRCARDVLEETEDETE